MRFDRRLFYVNYRKHFGGLSTQQVAGLNRLLDGIENDPHIPAEPIGIFYASYMLATVKRETAHTFMPIHEYGSHAYFVRRYGGQTKKGRELGNDTPEEGYFYRGASDVQVTGESNFEKVEDAIRREYPNLVTDFEHRTGKTFDLTVGDQSDDVHDPDNILDPKISYAVMSYGMRTGIFTGKKLSQFVKNGVPNYKGMRTIINGHDHDDEIAADAKAFEVILTNSLTAETFNNDIDSKVGTIALPGAQTEQNKPPIPSDLPTDDQPSKAQPEQSAPGGLIQNITQKADGLGDQFQKVQDILGKFGYSNPTAEVSKSSWLITIFKIVLGLGVMAWGFVKDNWEIIAVAVVLIIVAAWFISRAKDRKLYEKLGTIPPQ